MWGRNHENNKTITWTKIFSLFVEIKKAFDVFDIEEDGRIRTGELENALRIAKMNPTPDDIEEIKAGLSDAGKDHGASEYSLVWNSLPGSGDWVCANLEMTKRVLTLF